MHSYSVYDLCLHSDIPLPGLPEGGHVPDVEIRLMELHIPELEAGARGGDRITGHVEGRLLIEVEGGRRIAVHPIRPMPEDAIPGYITGVLLAMLLCQRGLHLLHASCVARGGEAVAFVGESGWGKSTMAEAFLQRGYTVLTDDILALDLSGEAPRVVPGPPYIKLRPEAGGSLHHDFDSLPAVSTLTTQRFRSVEREEEPARAVLGRVYLLDPEDASENAIEPLSPQEAMLHLIAHSWGNEAFTEPAYRIRHLQHCSRIVREVPVHRLRRVRSLDALSDHVALVEQDLAVTAKEPLGGRLRLGS